MRDAAKRDNARAEGGRDGLRDEEGQKGSLRAEREREREREREKEMRHGGGSLVKEGITRWWWYRRGREREL